MKKRSCRAHDVNEVTIAAIAYRVRRIFSLSMYRSVAPI